MFSSADVGRLGESLAANFLAKKGYKIIETNKRQGHKEIDLICRAGELTVLVEVKTARAIGLIKPEELLSAQKIKKLKRAMVLYCQEQRLSLDRARFDLVAVSLDYEKKLAKVKHFENIF
jgi:putative endonuclease